jgi:hypothetical protein
MKTCSEQVRNIWFSNGFWNILELVNNDIVYYKTSKIGDPAKSFGRRKIKCSNDCANIGLFVNYLKFTHVLQTTGMAFISFDDYQCTSLCGQGG